MGKETKKKQSHATETTAWQWWNVFFLFQNKNMINNIWPNPISMELNWQKLIAIPVGYLWPNEDKQLVDCIWRFSLKSYEAIFSCWFCSCIVFSVNFNIISMGCDAIWSVWIRLIIVTFSASYIANKFCENQNHAQFTYCCENAVAAKLQCAVCKALITIGLSAECHKVTSRHVVHPSSCGLFAVFSFYSRDANSSMETRLQ